MDLKDPRERGVNQARLAREGLPVSRESVVTTALLAHKGRVEVLAQPDSAAPVDPQDHKARLALVGREARPAPRENAVKQVPQGHPVLVANGASQGREERPAHQVHKDHQGHLAPQDRGENKELPGKVEKRESQEGRAQLAPAVHRERGGTPVPPDPQDQRDLTDGLAREAKEDPQDPRDHQEVRERGEVPGKLDHRDHRDHREREDQVDKPDHRDLRDLQGKPDNKVCILYYLLLITHLLLMLNG